MAWQHPWTDPTEPDGGLRVGGKPHTGFAAIVEHSPDGIAVVGLDGSIRYANISAAAMLGRERDGLVGQQLPFVVGQGPADVEIRSGYAAGHAEARTSMCDWYGEPAVLIVLRDVTSRRRTEQELAYRATHDALTGLPNRFLFDDRLAHALARLQRDYHRLAVIFCDIDDFKGVNDRFGHLTGDEVLVKTADRLRAVLRSGDTAARIGGDEFVLVCEDTDAAAAAKVARRVRAALQSELRLNDGRLRIGVSVGVAVTDDPHGTPALLLQRADADMYLQKVPTTLTTLKTKARRAG